MLMCEGRQTMLAAVNAAGCCALACPMLLTCDLLLERSAPARQAEI